MKTLIYDKKELNSYKDFYEKLYEDMDGKNMIDWEEFDYLGYNGTTRTINGILYLQLLKDLFNNIQTTS